MRLTDDHGIERGGDAEEVADGFAVAILVEVRAQGGGGDGEVLVEEFEEIWSAFLDWILNCEELYAVAGRENEGLADALDGGERTGGVGEARWGDGEALANFERRGVVVDAEENQFAHGARNPWTVLIWLAEYTARMTMKTKEER